MSKTCEVCDRPIRTGRKYCFEHRRTISENPERKLQFINQIYIKQGTIEFIKNHYKYPLIGIIILWLVYALNSIFKIKFVSKLLFYILYLGIIFVVAFVISERNRLRDRTKNRHPHYIGWVRGFVEIEKEDKEFKKSLLK